jgi:hypothetical protein
MVGSYPRPAWRRSLGRVVALPDISNNVGPVKLFLNTLLSFHLKEVFSFVFFVSRYSASTTMARL